MGQTSEINVARRAGSTFIPRVIVVVDQIGLTEVLSTDSAVVGLAVHVCGQVHSLLGHTSDLKVARSADINFIPSLIKLKKKLNSIPKKK